MMETLLKFDMEPSAGAATVVVIGSWVMWGIVHVAFAIGVFAHARGRVTTFVSPVLWTLATLLGGPVVALYYWLMHAASLGGVVKQ